MKRGKWNGPVPKLPSDLKPRVACGGQAGKKTFIHFHQNISGEHIESPKYRGGEKV